MAEETPDGTVGVAADEEVGPDDLGPSMLVFPRETWDTSWREPRVRLYRQDPITTKWSLHGYFPIDTFTDDVVAQAFGGGRWIAQVIASDDRGKQDIRRSRRIELSGAYRPPIKSLPGLDPAGTAPAPSPGGPVPSEGPMVTGRMSPAEMISSLQVQQLIDISAAGRKAAPAVDYTPLILKGMEVLAAFLTRPKETDGLDVLRVELGQLREAVQAQANKPGPATSGIADVVEAMQSLMGLRDMISDGGGKKESGEDALYSLGGKLVEFLGNQKQPAAAEIPTGQLGATVGTMPTPTPTPVTAMPIWQQVLLRYARDMVNAATRGVDPNLAADYTAAMIPSEVEGAVREFLARPDADTVLVQVVPQMGQFQAWTVEYIKGLREAFSPEAGQEE